MSVVKAQKQFLLNLIADFHTAMLVKTQPSGLPVVRPVLIASLEQGGRAVVATTDQGPEITGLDGEDVMLTFQGLDQFAWVYGKASVERSRAQVARFWTDEWANWFTKGKTDPALCLIVVDGAEGEYWDRRVVGGFDQVIETAKAYFVGSTQIDCPPHGKIKLAKPQEKRARAARRDPPVEPPILPRTDPMASPDDGAVDPLERRALKTGSGS